MRKAPVVLIGKAARTASRLRGGGTALPGLVVEKLDPGFLAHALDGLKYGVVLVSGTNGKTTTTKMVVELLEGQGLKVFTNPSGSNFIRGVIAALIPHVRLDGRLDADVAVLELDEAHAVRFVNRVKPAYSLLLNVMRDQLDRFGEIDTTARMLEQIAKVTTKTVVINREDARLRTIGSTLPQVAYYGLSPTLKKDFPSDDELYGASATGPDIPKADVVLMKSHGHAAMYDIAGDTRKLTLKLSGSYNMFNAAGAVALVRAVLDGRLRLDPLLQTLATVTPAFGRGETLTVDGQPCELVLVKNPGGFRLALSSFDPAGYATMIAINDAYADGRDVSWLWDVGFESLTDGVAVVTGSRAYDMALRLDYEEVAVGVTIPAIDDALRVFLDQNADVPKRIYCTYTAMLAIRRLVAARTGAGKAF